MSRMEEVSERRAVSRRTRTCLTRCAVGSPLRQRASSRDTRIIVLDSLRADVVFGWRQLNKHKVTSMAAVLWLGLAIGSCEAAFRLIDALFLRPLPISDPQR